MWGEGREEGETWNDEGQTQVWGGEQENVRMGIGKKRKGEVSWPACKLHKRSIARMSWDGMFPIARKWTRTFMGLVCTSSE